MFHRLPKPPASVRVSLSPLLIDSFHFAHKRRGFQNHPLIRCRVPSSIPVVTTIFAILIPRMWKPPLRHRVVISNTHDMMIIGILNARLHDTHPGEFAAARNTAEQGKANNHDDDAWDNEFHSESPHSNTRRHL